MASKRSLHSGHHVATSAHLVMQLRQNVCDDADGQPRRVQGSTQMSRQMAQSTVWRSSCPAQTNGCG